MEEYATAELLDSELVVRSQKEASTIYNKGFFGEPQSGGSLKLSMIEAVFLINLGRLNVTEAGEALEIKDIMRYAADSSPEFEIKYIVYSDLRTRGYVVKAFSEQNVCSGIDFAVYPRGGNPKMPAEYWTIAISERARFSIDELQEQVKVASGVRKKLMLAIADEEGDITYYEVSPSNPKGKVEKAKLPATGAMMLKDRVFLWDEKVAEAYLRPEFYGKPLGKGIQLSLVETAHLMKKGALQVMDGRRGKPIEYDDFVKKARRIQHDFDLRLCVYEDLKSRGLIVKTGFKFGSHFRVYRGDPDKCHAEYLVHALPSGYKATWPEISRAIRLAHSVKKEMILARISESGIEYVLMGRARP
ncbi:MAG: tRNA-intron lyase [Candidatus Thermoplasmatota archaeon]|nr:tRNA-intron lyase [Candidatus Thermoplasmatota archaeon]